MQTEDNLRAGLSPIEARRQAMLKFGGVEAIKEDYRSERGLPLIENLMRDVRFALRLLCKSPGFTAVAVLTLAMAISANTVVFGLLDALMLRPLNVPQPESLYQLERACDKVGTESYPNYLDLRDPPESSCCIESINQAYSTQNRLVVGLGSSLGEPQVKGVEKDSI